MFQFIDGLVQKAKDSKGPFRFQFAALQAVSTFLRRPGNVTVGAPHVRDATDVKRVMFLVVISLLPCLVFGIYNTGRSAYLSIGAEFTLWQAFLEGALFVLPLVILSYAVGGFCEMLFAQIRGHEIAEGFLVTGILYPLICPATIPWWMFCTGIIFGVIIGKEVFGGTGMNIINPALTARAFLFFAYPAAMSGDIWIAEPFHKLESGALAANWWTTIAPEKIQAFVEGTRHAVDGFSGPTPLSILQVSQPGVNNLVELEKTYTWMEMFFGFIPGSIGETSALMCLLGAFLLILTGVGSWRTMAGVIVGGIAMTFIFNAFASPNLNPALSISPWTQMVMGGFAFGAIFMATDPVSSPLHNGSKWIYGILIGVMCILIRIANPAFPEGMMLSILFINLFAPLIDHFVLNRAVKRRMAHAK